MDVVVVGGGFAGLVAVSVLAGAPLGERSGLLGWRRLLVCRGAVPVRC